MADGELRLVCRVCGTYFLQDTNGNLLMTSEQRCMKLAEDLGETVVAYKFTCPECEREAKTRNP